MFKDLLYIVGIICAIWVLYDVWAKNKKLNDTGKLVWSIFAIFFNIITAIVYYLRYKSK